MTADFFLLVSQLNLHVIDPAGQNAQVLVKHKPGLVFSLVLVRELLNTCGVLFNFEPVLVLHSSQFLLVLSHQGLLSAVGLVAELFDHCLDLAVSFANHLLSNLALRLYMLVLSTLQHVCFKLFLLNDQTFLQLFHFKGVATLAVIDPVVARLQLGTDFILAAQNYLLDLVF